MAVVNPLTVCAIVDIMPAVRLACANFFFLPVSP